MSRIFPSALAALLLCTACASGVQPGPGLGPRRGYPLARLRIYYVYTFSMSERAKIFQNGGSQAVRLPKSCRFSDGQNEVLVRRVGKQVILEPADEWPAEFLACLGAWTEDIPRPPAKATGRKKDPFDS